MLHQRGALPIGRDNIHALKGAGFVLVSKQLIIHHLHPDIDRKPS
jgi:hypothetical protein